MDLLATRAAEPNAAVARTDDERNGGLPESEGLGRPFTRRFDRLKLVEQRLVQGEIILGGGE